MIKYITTVNGEEFQIELLDDNKINVNGKIYELDFEEVSGQMVYTLLVDGKSFEARVSESDNEWHVYMRGTMYTAKVLDEREKRLRAAGSEGQGISGEYTLKSPMPGLVIKVPVSQGDQIKKGDVLVILESMKMQNELKSPQDGTVSHVGIQQDDRVEQKQTLIIITPPKDTV